MARPTFPVGRVTLPYREVNMSIYGTTLDIRADDHAENCAQWVKCRCSDAIGRHRRVLLGNNGRHWRYDEDRPCTCLCGPLAYQGSHILPSPTDKRGGSFGFGEIAGFITRDGRDDGPEDEDQPWPYLRATMCAEDAEDCQDVVLDRPLIVSLRDYLTSFLERTAPAVVDVHLPEPSREDTPA